MSLLTMVDVSTRVSANFFYRYVGISINLHLASMSKVSVILQYTNSTFSSAFSTV